MTFLDGSAHGSSTSCSSKSTRSSFGTDWIKRHATPFRRRQDSENCPAVSASFTVQTAGALVLQQHELHALQSVVHKDKENIPACTMSQKPAPTQGTEFTWTHLANCEENGPRTAGMLEDNSFSLHPPLRVVEGGKLEWLDQNGAKVDVQLPSGFVLATGNGQAVNPLNYPEAKRNPSTRKKTSKNRSRAMSWMKSLLKRSKTNVPQFTEASPPEIIKTFEQFTVASPPEIIKTQFTEASPPDIIKTVEQFTEASPPEIIKTVEKFTVASPPKCIKAVVGDFQSDVSNINTEQAMNPFDGMITSETGTAAVIQYDNSKLTQFSFETSGITSTISVPSVDASACVGFSPLDTANKITPYEQATKAVQFGQRGGGGGGKAEGDTWKSWGSERQSPMIVYRADSAVPPSFPFDPAIARGPAVNSDGPPRPSCEFQCNSDPGLTSQLGTLNMKQASLPNGQATPGCLQARVRVDHEAAPATYVEGISEILQTTRHQLDNITFGLKSQLGELNIQQVTLPNGEAMQGCSQAKVAVGPATARGPAVNTSGPVPTCGFQCNADPGLTSQLGELNIQQVTLPNGQATQGCSQAKVAVDPTTAQRCSKATARRTSTNTSRPVPSCERPCNTDPGHRPCNIDPGNVPATSTMDTDPGHVVKLGKHDPEEELSRGRPDKKPQTLLPQPIFTKNLHTENHAITSHSLVPQSSLPEVTEGSTKASPELATAPPPALHHFTWSKMLGKSSLEQGGKGGTPCQPTPSSPGDDSKRTALRASDVETTSVVSHEKGCEQEWSARRCQPDTPRTCSIATEQDSVVYRASPACHTRKSLSRLPPSEASHDLTKSHEHGTSLTPIYQGIQSSSTESACRGDAECTCTTAVVYQSTTAVAAAAAAATVANKTLGPQREDSYAQRPSAPLQASTAPIFSSGGMGAAMDQGGADDESLRSCAEPAVDRLQQRNEAVKRFLEGLIARAPVDAPVPQRVHVMGRGEGCNDEGLQVFPERMRIAQNPVGGGVQPASAQLTPGKRREVGPSHALNVRNEGMPCGMGRDGGVEVGPPPRESGQQKDERPLCLAGQNPFSRRPSQAVDSPAAMLLQLEQLTRMTGNGFVDNERMTGSGFVSKEGMTGVSDHVAASVGAVGGAGGLESGLESVRMLPTLSDWSARTPACGLKEWAWDEEGEGGFRQAMKSGIIRHI